MGRAKKCDLCGKPVRECPVGGDPSKVCQGHDIFERRAAERRKDGQ